MRSTNFNLFADGLYTDKQRQQIAAACPIGVDISWDCICPSCGGLDSYFTNSYIFPDMRCPGCGHEFYRVFDAE